MITVPMTVAASNVELIVSVGESNAEYKVSTGLAYSLVKNPDYEGEYTVTPRLYDQYLETNNKVMTDDVTVYEIPVVYTSNVYGGKTVVIG